MELRHAVTLLAQAIVGFREAVEPNDKYKMADVVTTLREVIPNVLTDDMDRKSFDKFVDVVRTDVSAAGHYALSASTPTRQPRCVDNGSFVNCGGPPGSQSRCDLCNKIRKLYRRMIPSGTFHLLYACCTPRVFSFEQNFHT